MERDDADPIRNARDSIEIARHRAVETDRALAELRSTLRSAAPPSTTARPRRDGASGHDMEPAAVYRWLLLDGHEAFCRGRFADALAMFEQAAREGPRRVEGHLNVGRTLLRVGRLADARESFNRAVALEPENDAARAGLADCNWRLALPEIEPAPAPRPTPRFRIRMRRAN
jgi:tetratricopeptide (TPR) repeat protein